MTIELINAPFFGDNIPAYRVDNTIYYIWDNEDYDTLKGISYKYIRYIDPKTLNVYGIVPSMDHQTCVSWIGLMQNFHPKGWDLDTTIICKLVDNKMIPLSEEELKSNLDLDNLYLELPTTPVSDSYKKETLRVIKEIQNSINKNKG